MPEKNWVDCPACGARRSMRILKGQNERFTPAGYPSLEIPDLDGQFCEICDDGFWSPESERRMAHLLAEHLVQHDENLP